MIKFEFSFDDGSKHDLKIIELLQKYNITDVTFYVPANWITYLCGRGIEPLSIEDIEQISKDYELGSHTINHFLLTRYPLEVVNKEITDSKRILQEMFNVTVDKFCYPRGYFNQDIKNQVEKAGYKSARTVAVGELSPPHDPYQTNTTVHVGLDRKEYGTNWLDYARKKLTEAIRRAHDEEIIYHAWGHSEEVVRLGQIGNFEVFLKEISSL